MSRCKLEKGKIKGRKTNADLDIYLNSELGVHIDGYIATAAHTVIVVSNPQEPTTGKAADVVAATHFAYEAALRMLRPGVKVS